MPLAALALLLQLLSWLAPCALAGESMGILKVKSSVATAEVYVDGTLLGKAPVTKYMPSGAHTIRVVADFHDPWVRRVEILADKTVDLNATLTPGPGSLEFTGPPGGHVFLDGTDRGALPIRLPAPSPGAHTWRVEAPKFEPAEGKIEVEAGKNYLVEAQLPSSAGVFVVESTPPGARVQLDGEDVGVTPLRLTGVPLGKHGVLLSMEGRSLVAKSVDTTDGSRGEVKATLSEDGATLAVATGDEAARVFVDDVFVGAGKLVQVGPFPKGRTRVRVEIGDKRASDTVTLPSRGNVALEVSGGDLVARKPLVQRWTFWAAVGGGVAAGGAAAAVVAAANQPEPPPAGDTVVALP